MKPIADAEPRAPVGGPRGDRTVRDLDASQLDFREMPGKPTVQQWVARGSGVTPDQLRGNAGERLRTGLGHDLDLEPVPLDDAERQGRTCSRRRQDDVDRTLIWRTLVTCAPASGEDPHRTPPNRAVLASDWGSSGRGGLPGSRADRRLDSAAGTPDDGRRSSGRTQIPGAARGRRHASG